MNPADLQRALRDNAALIARYGRYSKPAAQRPFLTSASDVREWIRDADLFAGKEI